MKTFAPLFLTTLAITRLVAAEPAAPTADEIIAQSSKAYRERKTFKGTCKVESMLSYSMNGTPGMMNSKASASFDFKRGTSFVIKGVETSGGTFTIDNRGGKTTLTTNFGGKTKVEKMDELGMAVASMTGVAAGAPTTIPALLTGETWGYPYHRGATLALKGHEKVGKYDCFLISQTNKGVGSVDTFWIDSTNFLLRQMRSQTGPMKFEDPEVKDLGAMKILSNTTTETFTVEE